MLRRFAAFTRRAVLDRNKSLVGRSRLTLFRRSNAHIIPSDIVLLGQLGAGHIDPALDVVVPRVGRFAQINGSLGLALHFRHIGGGQQGRNFGSQRERRVARILLPTVLLRDRAVVDYVGGGAAHHRPETRQRRCVKSILAPQQVDQQNRERG